MDIAHLQQRALEVRDAYREQGKLLGEKPWTATQYCSALTGDVGDLSKLVMMYEGYRTGDDV